MSNLTEFAKQELDLIGMNDGDPMNAAMRNHILHMVKEFGDEGHSGFSASYAVDLLSRLLRYKPLSPLTGNDDEWMDVSDCGGRKDGPLWQNTRHHSIFKDNEGAYDIDGKVFWEWWKHDDGTVSKMYYSNFNSCIPVTFPYTVPDSPVYEWCPSDSAPPQTEEGLIYE